MLLYTVQLVFRKAPWCQRDSRGLRIGNTWVLAMAVSLPHLSSLNTRYLILRVDSEDTS